MKVFMEELATTKQKIYGIVKSLKSDNANEAETRFKLIDTILKDVLKWETKDIDVEKHVREDNVSTFADYILKTANTALVIEAKRISNFTLGDYNQRKILLGKRFLETELGGAVVQARDYARGLGIDFACVTNGVLWFIFPAQRHDQVSFNDSSGILFSSLDEIFGTYYSEFTGLINRSSVLAGSLELNLYGRAENQIDQRHLKSFFSPYSNISKDNPIYENLSNQIVTSFSEKVLSFDAEEFSRLYVPNAQNIRFDTKIRMTVSKRDTVVSKKTTRLMKAKDRERFVEKIAVNNDFSKLAFIIVGTVGCGKTTFLHYLEKVKLQDLLSDKSNNFHWIRIDFLESTKDTPYTKFIYDHLFKYIQNSNLGEKDYSILPAYSEEIESLKRGPLAFLADENEQNREISNLILADYKEKSPYIEKIFKYHADKSNIYIIVDNIDQIESDEKQGELFSATLSIARKLDLNLIICLRQSTYIRNRNSPLINAYDYEYGQIDPPSVLGVLSKRFDLLSAIVEGISFSFIAENGAKVKVENASEVIGLLKESVLGSEVGRQIDILASEDLRLALRMTRDFLEKGYSNTSQGIQSYAEGKKYILPRHEALRAIIVGNHTVYDENYSAVGNVFDSKLSIHNLQLLKLFILNACVNRATLSSFEGIDGDEIIEHLKNIGVAKKYTRQVLKVLCEQRYLFTPSHTVSEDIAMYAPSRLGGYVVRELLVDFTFLENLMFDTYISDDETWQNLKEISHEIESEKNIIRKIDIRVKRIQFFWKYLTKSYSPLLSESLKRTLPSEWCNDLFGDNTVSLESTFSRVKRSANRNYSKPKRS